MVTIYALRCLVNNKAYIGCTKASVAKRFREHRCLLNADKHSTKMLQTDWNRYGSSMFIMQKLGEMPADATAQARRERELDAMTLFGQQGLLYNAWQISFQPPPGAQAMAAKARTMNGYRQSAESNQKRRLSQLGIPKGHGAKISATKQARKVMR